MQGSFYAGFEFSFKFSSINLIALVSIVLVIKLYICVHSADKLLIIEGENWSEKVKEHRGERFQ